VWESISKALHLLGLLPYLDRLLLFTRLYSAVLYAIRSRPCTCQNIICVSLGLSESKLSEEGRSPYIFRLSGGDSGFFLNFPHYSEQFTLPWNYTCRSLSSGLTQDTTCTLWNISEFTLIKFGIFSILFHHP